MKKLPFSVIITILVLSASVEPFSVVRTPVRGDRGSDPRALIGRISFGGKVIVDGSTATSGSNVLDGCIVATLADGEASIDLGPLGGIKLRPNTTIKLTVPSERRCEVLMLHCGSITQTVPTGVNARVEYDDPKQVEVAVRTGKVEINWERSEGSKKTDKRSVEAVKTRVVHRAKNVSADGQAMFTLNCCACCFSDPRQQNNNKQVTK